MTDHNLTNLDFSEIDTSDLHPDLNLGDLPSFDLQDIIADDDHPPANTDYMNNNILQQDTTVKETKKPRMKTLKHNCVVGGKSLISYFRKSNSSQPVSIKAKAKYAKGKKVKYKKVYLYGSLMSNLEFKD